MKKRRIFFLSAARSDYDLIAPVLFALRKYPKVEASVIATAAQVSPFHGGGVREIERDGFPIVARVESLLAAESWSARSLSCAALIDGLTRFLNENRPDILVVAGDREEHLAGAMVGNFLQVHVAHLYGGDRCIASDVDETFRPAISKLSHLHFTCSAGHRERLIRMGEAPSRVWATGAPSLDRLRGASGPKASTVLRKRSLPAQEPYFMVIQHPSPTLSCGREKEEMTELLEGVLSLGHSVLCSYPNADPGNIGVRQAIDEARSRHKKLAAYHNLPRAEFISLYRDCAAMVGNSSSLILESTFLKRPAILVGPRQDLRERALNVLRVGFQRKAIAAACRKALTDVSFVHKVKGVRSLYGDGKSAPRIARILSSCELDRSILFKTMPY